MSVHVTYYCKCGSAIDYNVPDIDVAQRIIEIFLSHHNGEGHGQTSAKKCRKARENTEREFENRPR
jgi:hypothetical protein